MTTFAVITPDGQRREISGERQVVAAAALFLGDGRFAVEDPAGAPVVPVLSTHDKLRWFRETFAADLNGVLREKRHDVAAALRSVDMPQAKFLATTLSLSDPRRCVGA